MRLVGPFVLTIIFAYGSSIGETNQKIPFPPVMPKCPKHDCNCEMNCWEKCFASHSTNRYMKKAYQNIYQMAVGIRNLYGPCDKPKGTAYLLDASLPYSHWLSNGIYQLQRNLASIATMVQPVGTQCNPFCMNKYINFGAFYPWGQNVPCLDRCQASAFFQNRFSQRWFYQRSRPYYSNTWNSMGQYLADYCFKREKCAAGSYKQLLLFFVNSNNFATWRNYCPTGSNPHYECAAVGVSPYSNLNNMASWSNSNNLYQIKYDRYHISAAKGILGCMNKNCCPHKIFKGRDLNDLSPLNEANDESFNERATAEKYNVAILGQNKQPQVLVKTGTQDEIVKGIIEKAPKPTKDIHPKDVPKKSG